MLKHNTTGSNWKLSLQRFRIYLQGFYPSIK